MLPVAGLFTAAWVTPAAAAAPSWFPIEGPLTKLAKEHPGPIPQLASKVAEKQGFGFEVPKIFQFSTEDIIADIKMWLQASLESWYHFVGTIFESMINLILYTPKMLITNPQVHMLWTVFISITVGLLSILCIVEAIKTVLGHSRTNFLQFLGRTVTAFAGISIILPAMTIGLDFVNEFVKYFTDLAFGHVKASEFIGKSMADTFTNGALGLLSSLVFIVLFLYYMFKILLNYGRRWFDIIISACISPMAIGATIFDSTGHYFRSWWSHTLQLYMVQVVHAIYITVLAVVVLTPAVLTGPVSGFMKILIIIGALWRMSTPPRFVSSMAGSPDSRGIIRDITRTIMRYKAFKKGGK